ncbi:MAG TPA: hypothetical protein VFX31_14000, partial [Ktedonobacterales bacterium]|nr:hypothetical protein [Ktedonobacterales bacterium]
MAERTSRQATAGRRIPTAPLLAPGARYHLRGALVALVMRVALLATLVALAQGLLVTTPPAFAAGSASEGAQPNHSPNTLSQFHASGTATGKPNGGANATH